LVPQIGAARLKRQLAKRGDVQTIAEKDVIGENGAGAVPAITARICPASIDVTLHRRAITRA
jgi:hypothetical protein